MDKELKHILRLLKLGKRYNKDIKLTRSQRDQLLTHVKRNKGYAPNFRNQLTKTILAINISNDDVKKRVKSGVIESLKGMDKISKEKLLNINDPVTTFVKPKGFEFTDEQAIKFGKNWGFGARKFMESHGGDYRSGIAEYILTHKNEFAPIAIKEAKAFLKWQKKNQTPEKDNFYYTARFGTKKVITNEDSPVLKTIRQLKKMAGTDATRVYLSNMEQKYIKENTFLLSDLKRLEDMGTKQALKKADLIKKSVGFPFLAKKLIRDFTLNAEKKLSKRTLELFARYDGEDLAYAIAKGIDRASYGELFRYIEINENPIFHPNCLTAFRESKVFHERYFKYFDKRWGKTKSYKWWEDNIMGDDATYTLVEADFKEHEKEKFVESLRKNEGNPFEEDEYQQSLVIAFYEKVQKWKDKKKKKEAKEAAKKIREMMKKKK